MKTVEHTHDTLPELTDERRRALERLAAQPDDAIDTSDISELSDEQWAGAVRGRFYRPIKQQIPRALMPTCSPGSKPMAADTRPA